MSILKKIEDEYEKLQSQDLENDEIIDNLYSKFSKNQDEVEEFIDNNIITNNEEEGTEESTNSGNDEPTNDYDNSEATVIGKLFSVDQIPEQIRRKLSGEQLINKRWIRFSDPLATTQTINSVVSILHPYFQDSFLLSSPTADGLNLRLQNDCDQIIDLCHEDITVEAMELQTIVTMSRSILASIRDLIVDGNSIDTIKQILTKSYEFRDNAGEKELSKFEIRANGKKFGL